MSGRVTRRGERGFTFLEMVAVVVVLAIVGGLGVQALQMTSGASSSTVFQSEMDTRVHRAVRRVVRELQEAEVASMLPQPLVPFGADAVDYRCAEISDDERIVLGEYRRLELLPAVGDPRDGRDNDSDGVVDEHTLWLVHDVGLPTERRTELARNVAAYLEGELANAEDDNGNGLVDETGFSLALRDGILHVRLSLQGRSPKGSVLTRTAETTVWVRN
mgnify:CR=1 FL=1